MRISDWSSDVCSSDLWKEVDPMPDFRAALGQALALIVSGDADLLEIIGLSLRVTFTSLLLACAPGLPLGASLAVARFPGRMAAIAVVHSLLGLPPVVAWSAGYLLHCAACPSGLRPAPHP